MWEVEIRPFVIAEETLGRVCNTEGVVYFAEVENDNGSAKNTLVTLRANLKKRWYNHTWT